MPIATVVTLIVNFLSGTGQLNNLTPQTLSDSYQVLFVPAGYVFSIWGLIYVGIILYSIYQYKTTSKTIIQTRELYIVSCLANISWLILWHYKQPVLSVFAMLALLASLITIYSKLKPELRTDQKRFWMVNIPFSLYLGWISVATIANITVALNALRFTGLGFAAENWSSVLIIIASILGVHLFLYKKDVTFALVIVWSIIGVGAKFQNIEIISFTSFTCTLILVAIIVLKSLFKHEDKLVLSSEIDAN